MKFKILIIALLVSMIPSCSTYSSKPLQYIDDHYSVINMNNKTVETIFNDEFTNFYKINASSKIKIYGANKDDSVTVFRLYGSPELYDYEEDKSLNVSYKDGYFINDNDFKGISSGRYYYCLVFSNNSNKRYIGFVTGQNIVNKEEYSTIIDFSGTQSIEFKGIDQASASNNYEGKVVKKSIEDHIEINDFISAFDKSVILYKETNNNYIAPGGSAYSFTIHYTDKESKSFGMDSDCLLFIDADKTFEIINPLIYQIIHSWMA